MAEEKITAFRVILDELLHVFKDSNVESIQFKDSLAALQDIYHSRPVDSRANLPSDNGSHRNLFHLLAVCLNQARIMKCSQLSEAFRILADASRDPKWRLDFGRHESHSTFAGWPPDPKHDSHNYSYEQWSGFESGSILQVAVRTLHARYVGYRGQAAYHALRLISNCCADSDANKRVVLECGVIEMLLRCAKMKIWPAVVIVALWNICAESEGQTRGEIEPSVEDKSNPEWPGNLPETQMSTIACTQLTLVSIGECDDINGMTLLAPEIECGRRPANFVKELLDLAEMVEDGTRKEMAAELLEKASWRVSLLNDTSPSNEAKNIIPNSARMIKPDLHIEDFLPSLLTGAGRSLAIAHPNCKCDIIRSITILLSQGEARRELTDGALIRALLQVPNWHTNDMEHDEAANSEVAREMLTVQQYLFKTIYDISSSSEFIARNTKRTQCPKLVSECIDALGDLSNLRPSNKTFHVIPAASACIVVANLTTSIEFALFLVQRRQVHLPIGLILHLRDDPTTLFPAIALLERLAIPPENKTAVFSAGIMWEVPRLLTEFDTQPSIQCEAVSLMRKVIIGHPKHVSGIGVCVPRNAGEPEQDQSHQRGQQQSGLLAALNLFRRTSDVQTRFEIGRLVVEVCRTLLHAASGHHGQAEDRVHQAFGNATRITDPIIYLACNGTTQEVEGEGWFGLAVLSMWERGRPFVIDCLAEEGIQRKMEEILRRGDQACRENISLMLMKLHLFPRHLVLASTRKFVELAASNAGLPPIWPEMAALV